MSRATPALGLLVVVALLVGGCAVAVIPGPPTGRAPSWWPGSAARAANAGPDLTAITDALVDAAVPGTGGGLAWPSAIQAPHHQTDRDVGAAGVAQALLAAAETTRDPAARDRWLTAARGAADFLVAAQDDTPGRFPDFVDPGETAPMAYTSFDDGATGIADVLWRMGEVTGDARYRTAARAGIDWVIDRAEGADGRDCPEMCRWAWSDLGTPSYRNGMGEGQAGIVWALSVFAERTGDPRIAEHARGGAAYLESRLDPDGGLPESDTELRRNTGYLSGTAGAAFALLRMHVWTKEQRWLDAAQRALGFLDRTGTPDADGTSWPIMVGGADGGGDGNRRRATGMEEGAAGIGWTSLQAWAVTGDAVHLRRAEAAGRWLQSVALEEDEGTAWAEYAGSSTVHSSTNSGVAGTGWFLDDLARATGDTSFADTARAARSWLTLTTAPERWGSRAGSAWTNPREPSWHWGRAGVVGFTARLAGWPVDSPGMQPGLLPGRP